MYHGPEKSERNFGRFEFGLGVGGQRKGKHAADFNVAWGEVIALYGGADAGFLCICVVSCCVETEIWGKVRLAIYTREQSIKLWVWSRKVEVHASCNALSIFIVMSTSETILTSDDIRA